jgi:hypothetical protein
VATVRQSQAAWRSEKTTGAVVAATDDDVIDCSATCWTQSDRSRRATVSHAGGSRSAIRCPFGSTGCGRRAHLSTGGSTPTALDISDVAFDDEYGAVFATAASSSAATAAATLPHLKPATCDFVFDLVDGRFVRSPLGAPVATSCGRSVTSLSSNGGGLLVVAAAATDDQAAAMTTTTHGGNGNVKGCHTTDCAVDSDMAAFGGFIDASTVLSCQS